MRAVTPRTYPRLRAIVDRIKADPSCWDQSRWHCGTSHCIAGHAQLDALPVNRRETFLRRYSSHSTWENMATETLFGWGGEEEDTDTFEGIYVSPYSAGRVWLGITHAEARELFSFSTTLEEIEAFLKRARLFAESAERGAK